MIVVYPWTPNSWLKTECRRLQWTLVETYCNLQYSAYVELNQNLKIFYDSVTEKQQVQETVQHWINNHYVKQVEWGWRKPHSYRRTHTEWLVESIITKNDLVAAVAQGRFQNVDPKWLRFDGNGNCTIYKPGKIVEETVQSWMDYDDRVVMSIIVSHE